MKVLRINIVVDGFDVILQDEIGIVTLHFVDLAEIATAEERLAGIRADEAAEAEALQAAGELIDGN